MRTVPTPRLTLEPQVASHADEMFSVLTDAALYEYENAPPPSPAWLRERFTKLESRRSGDGREQWLNWVARRRDDGRAAGFVQATVAPGGTAAVAYVLGSAHWGQGLAQEALRAMADELVASHGVHTVHALLKRANLRSLRLLLRLGFALGARLPGVPGEVPDDEWMLARRWPPGAEPLFSTPAFEVRELRREQAPLLQALFDDNPLYLRTVNGRDPRPDEAETEFDELPPPHLPVSRRWIAGVRARGSEALVGVVDGCADLGAAGVWHLGLFLMATALHGSGAAAEVCRGLEGWVRGQGARWLRLGVVQGNARAERFWLSQGYTETRVREGVDTGGRVNTVRVMVKPLAAAGAGWLDDYLARVPRDRRGSEPP